MLGKYKTKLPGVGKFFQFLKTTPGYIVCILLPFLLLILMQGLHCIQLFRRYKAEQTAELRQQQEQLEKERAEAQKMLSELSALKQQLAAEQKKTTEAAEESEAVSAHDE